MIYQSGQRLFIHTTPCTHAYICTCTCMIKCYYTRKLPPKQYASVYRWNLICSTYVRVHTSTSICVRDSYEWQPIRLMEDCVVQRFTNPALNKHILQESSSFIYGARVCLCTFINTTPPSNHNLCTYVHRRQGTRQVHVHTYLCMYIGASCISAHKAY